MIKKLAVAAALCATAGLACASGEGWYVTGGMGLSHHDFSSDEAELSDLATQAGTTLSYSDSKNQFGMKIGGGYKFNQNLALEGHFYYLGEAKADAAIGPVSMNASTESLGVGVDVLGILPVMENLDVFAKVGAAVMTTTQEMSVSVPGGWAWQEARKTRLVPKLGVGAEYALTEHWAVRADYDHFFKTSHETEWQFKTNHDLFTIGAKYAF